MVGIFNFIKDIRWPLVPGYFGVSEELYFKVSVLAYILLRFSLTILPIVAYIKF